MMMIMKKMAYLATVLMSPDLTFHQLQDIMKLNQDHLRLQVVVQLKEQVLVAHFK